MDSARCERTQSSQQCISFHQVRITTEGGLVKSLKGKAVVARSPSYLLGDIRVLEMVHVPGLEHLGRKMLRHDLFKYICALVDCVVFPTNGRRPHADEMAGGDLDRDSFFVSWDERLVPSYVRPAADYEAAPAKKEKGVTIEGKIAYFANQRNLQGTVDFLYNAWADKLGPGCDQCERLGILFGRVIDAAKSGEQVAIENTDVNNKNNYIAQGCHPRKPAQA